MNQETRDHYFLDQCDQVVVYGANGWVGRSAIDLISSLNPTKAKSQLLLIGSKRGAININQINFEIYDPNSGIEKIKENAIFFNSAFLRREFITSIGIDEYTKKNLEITTFASRVIQSRKLSSFVNLSSGAAKDGENESFENSIDVYSGLKRRSEIEFSEICDENDTNFVNCRIYSLSGQYMNEFRHLALSSFFHQAIYDNQICVSAPLAKRTYVDARELSHVLITLAVNGGSHALDSGGVLITMEELANQVATFFHDSDLEVFLGNQTGTEYFGDYSQFNQIAKGLNIELSGIESQILNTSKAFKL